MPDISDFSTWGRACALWFWTNVSGVAGVHFSLIAVVLLDHNNRSSGGSLFFTGLIGLIAALVSLPMIPAAYVLFRQLLPIPSRGTRLLATGGIICAAFIGTLWLAIAAVDAGVAFGGAMGMGGWAYLLAALGAAGWVYRPALFRPDNAALSPDAPDAAA